MELADIGRLDPDDPLTARQVRSRRRRRALWSGGLAVGFYAVIAVVLALGGWSPRSLLESDWTPPPALEVVAFALLLVAFGLIVTGLILAIRGGQVRRGRRSPLWMLTRAQRNGLQRQIMANTVEAGTDPALLRQFATSLRAQRRIIPLMAGMIAMLVGATIINPTPLQLVLTGLSVVSLVPLSFVFVRQADRAEIFLHDHRAALENS